jgi:acid phosphatase family membrane protein YuiD
MRSNLIISFWFDARKPNIRRRCGRSLRDCNERDKRAVGHPPSLRTKEVPLMEHFLLNVLAAIVAGVVVAWIAKRFNR